MSNANIFLTTPPFLRCTLNNKMKSPLEYVLNIGNIQTNQKGRGDDFYNRFTH